MKPPHLQPPRLTDLATGERIPQARPRTGLWPAVRWFTFMLLVAVVGWFAGMTVARFYPSGQSGKKSIYSAKIPPSRIVMRLDPQTGQMVEEVVPEEKQPEIEPVAKKAFEDGPYRKGELILRANTAEEVAALIKQVQEAGGTVLGVIRGQNTIRVSFTNAESMSEFLKGVRNNGAGAGPGAVASMPVEVTYNNVVTLPTPPPAPFDPFAPGSLVPFGSTALSSIGVPAENGSWGKGITVAVLDAPVSQKTQDMMQGDNFKQVNLLDSTGSAEPGHGDLVVSLLTGTSSQQGMVPGAKVLSIPVLSGDGSGDVFSVADAIYEAVDRNANVINMSLGTDQASPILEAAVNYATSKGVVIVAAVGNDGYGQVSYPAAYPDVVAVSSVDATGQRATFSNYGDAVDIAAPGVGITTYTGVGNNMWFSGTSSSSPLVAAAIAEVMSANTGLNGTQAVQVVKQNADYTGPVTGNGTNALYGAGVINMERALNSGDPFRSDLAIADIYVNVTSMPSVGTAPTQIVVQNRGTKLIFNAQVQIDYLGQHVNEGFAALAPGQAEAITLNVPLAQLTSAEGVVIQASVSAMGESDLHPEDNSLARLIRLVPATPGNTTSK